MGNVPGATHYQTEIRSLAEVVDSRRVMCRLNGSSCIGQHHCRPIFAGPVQTASYCFALAGLTARGK